MTSERQVQASVRDALAGRASIFRANVGQGWQGRVVQQDAGRVLLDGARPFSTGLPVGFADLFGWVAHEVKEEDVGTSIARFVAMEVKQYGAKPTGPQVDFLRSVCAGGGIGAVVRSPAEALQALSPRLWLSVDTTELRSLCGQLRVRGAGALADVCGVSARTAHGWWEGWTAVHPSALRLLQLLAEHYE